MEDFRNGIYTPLPPSERTAKPAPYAGSEIPRISAGVGTIVETGQAPFPSESYTFENRWYEVKDGRSIVVYAGALAQEPSQGVLIVVVQTLNYGPVPGAGGYYPTPLKAGAVRVVDAEGEVLTLSSESGMDFVFDGASRRWLVPDINPTPTPAPTVTPALIVLDTVAIDTDVNGNTATSLGSRKACSTLKAGGALAIDITIHTVPPVGEAGGGIRGFEFTLVYDPDVVKVKAWDHDMLVGANAGSRLLPISYGTPDTDGSFLAAAADLADPTNPESGSGVLARVTLEGVGRGVSDLTLKDVIVMGDALSPLYTIRNVVAARVAVDAPCP